MAKTSSSIMRGRVLLQRRMLVENASGEPEEHWQDVTVLHASVEPLKGREFFRGTDMPQRAAQVDTRMRIRYRTGLNPAEHRLVHAGIVYDLTAVIQDRGRRQTQLMVTATATHQADGRTVNA